MVRNAYQTGIKLIQAAVCIVLAAQHLLHCDSQQSHGYLSLQLLSFSDAFMAACWQIVLAANYASSVLQQTEAPLDMLFVLSVSNGYMVTAAGSD